MSGNGQVLIWPARVVTGEDLRHSLNGHRELILAANAVVTPLAVDELRERGIRVSRKAAGDEATQAETATGPWGYAQERPYPLVASAVMALRREKRNLTELPGSGSQPIWEWAREVGGLVGRNDCRGAVFFCHDPGLVCCVVNKMAGLRGVTANTVNDAARATLTVGANVIVVEMPGRTYFEVRQILRTASEAHGPACPDGLRRLMEELEGHAHR